MYWACSILGSPTWGEQWIMDYLVSQDTMGKLITGLDWTELNWTGLSNISTKRLEKTQFPAIEAYSEWIICCRKFDLQTATGAISTPQAQSGWCRQSPIVCMVILLAHRSWCGWGNHAYFSTKWCATLVHCLSSAVDVGFSSPPIYYGNFNIFSLALCRNSPECSTTTEFVPDALKVVCNACWSASTRAVLRRLPVEAQDKHNFCSRHTGTLLSTFCKLQGIRLYIPSPQVLPWRPTPYVGMAGNYSPDHSFQY